MQKNDTISHYLTRFTQFWDELGWVCVNVEKYDLVSVDLLGLPKSWHNYQESMNMREKLLNLERVWSSLVHKEIRRNTRDGSSSKEEDEEKFS